MTKDEGEDDRTENGGGDGTFKFNQEDFIQI